MEDEIDPELGKMFIFVDNSSIFYPVYISDNHSLIWWLDFMLKTFCVTVPVASKSATHIKSG